MKVGDKFLTKNCGECEIVLYKNAREVTVMFLSGYKMTTQAGNIRRGTIRDPLWKSLHGIGFIGVGKHKVSIDRKATREYACWREMINRCYNPECKGYNRYGGAGVRVIEEWHNFQNYAEWFKLHDKGSNFAVDKDLRVPDLKVYSKDTCEFIPQKLNSLLTSRVSCRGDCPVGVSFRKSLGVYDSHCNDGTGALKYLGRFSNESDAFNSYKSYKESLIKRLASEAYCAGNISEQVYTTLMDLVIIPFPE